MLSGDGVFETFFVPPQNSGIEDPHRFPFEWTAEIPYARNNRPHSIFQYYDWLNDNIGPVPRWDIDKSSTTIYDDAVRIRFLFKYKEDLIGFKLRWFGLKDA
jgi:hypothetical protein